MNRRAFLSHSLASTAALGTGVFALAQRTDPSASSSYTPPISPSPAKEPARGTPIDAAVVKAFVSAGHRDLPKVKELLAAYPRVIDASWDLGGGDWETALGAASHTGNREIALYLLERGARPDLFCAAMLGHTDAVTSLVRLSPASANARGPHGYSVMYHAGYSGDLAMAEALGSRLSTRGQDCNQALLSAVSRGHLEFVRWLLVHGADNVNVRSFGKTPLDLALQKGHADIANLLRAHGATNGG